MKKNRCLLLLASLFLLIGCQNQPTQDAQDATNSNLTEQELKMERLVKNVINAVRTDNLQDFKNNCFTLDLMKRQDSTVTEKIHASQLKEMFAKSKENFSKKGLEPKDLKYLYCDKPHREYEFIGLNFITFYAYFEDPNGKKIKVRFSDCSESPEGYLLGESLVIKN
ncbi:MAG: hypothetical protein IPM77_17450 [Crocinitomicaceae bacterium]|nr:hypothetical protein [Crocinitomicaceae bacterium]